ncbi:hypothetical protein K504DRAFT_451434 [Pleomassaria siparia CBS 279.74]|uniref:Uncharacterized protein n=1 Tax=Pleomassaria siparia CBS 279.74 TaxID=1314801 RepID=A0A6G1JTJ8_9PLEO|nr:hypothetical protein K504DRAFT_451434 [Pleomassaria siparia CBS 279.74]
MTSTHGKGQMLGQVGLEGICDSRSGLISKPKYRDLVHSRLVFAGEDILLALGHSARTPIWTWASLNLDVKWSFFDIDKTFTEPSKVITHADNIHTMPDQADAATKLSSIILILRSSRSMKIVNPFKVGPIWHHDYTKGLCIRLWINTYDLAKWCISNDRPSIVKEALIPDHGNLALLPMIDMCAPQESHGIVLIPVTRGVYLRVGVVSARFRKQKSVFDKSFAAVQIYGNEAWSGHTWKHGR